jgi:parallel beta-helix repeat protein
MTSTKTTTTTKKTNHYFRALVALAALAMMAMLLTAKPSHASTTFTVNSVGDQADLRLLDAVCDVDTQAQGDQCTLRGAIQQSDATPGADQINSQGLTILPNSPLPPINGQTTIDGYIQPGSSPNTLAQGDNAVINVQLDGRSAGNARGLVFNEASNSIVQGLAINRFSSSGIVVQGGLGVRIGGNFIGTDTTGTLDLGHGGSGVTLEGAGTGAGGAHVVGGSTPASRNVISGNERDGISIFLSTTNTVQGNYIGTDKSGTDNFTNDDMGNNGFGVSIEKSANNTIGGSAAGQSNVISNNDRDGVSVSSSTDNRVLGNRIGTDKSGTKGLGNVEEGVEITDSSENSVKCNTIAFNGKDGVSVAGGGVRSANISANTISSNSIFSNGGLGINLINPNVAIPVGESEGPTPNDTGDGDTGPNGLQNKPVISSAKTISGLTTIKGKLNSHPNETYTIELFSNPSGNEGKKLITHKSVTTDGSGNRSFTFSPSTKVAVGRTVTATATRDSTLDTSEFSAPKKVASS